MLNLSCPWQGEGFDIGVTVHGFDDAFLVAQPRVFDSPERRHFYPISRYLPNVDGPGLQLIDKPGDVIESVGADATGQTKSGGIGDFNSVINVLDTDYRNGRAKGFFHDQFAFDCHG